MRDNCVEIVSNPDHGSPFWGWKRGILEHI